MFAFFVIIIGHRGKNGTDIFSKKNEVAKKIKNMQFTNATYALSSKFEDYSLIHIVNERNNDISAKRVV